MHEQLFFFALLSTKILYILSFESHAITGSSSLAISKNHRACGYTTYINFAMTDKTRMQMFSAFKIFALSYENLFNRFSFIFISFQGFISKLAVENNIQPLKKTEIVQIINSACYNARRSSKAE